MPRCAVCAMCHKVQLLDACDCKLHEKVMGVAAASSQLCSFGCMSRQAHSVSRAALRHSICFHLVKNDPACTAHAACHLQLDGSSSSCSRWNAVLVEAALNAPCC